MEIINKLKKIKITNYNKDRYDILPREIIDIIFYYSINYNLIYINKYYNKIIKKKINLLKKKIINKFKILGINLDINKKINFSMKLYCNKFKNSGITLSNILIFKNNDINLFNKYNLIYEINIFNKIRRGERVLFKLQDENIIRVGVIYFKSKKNCYITYKKYEDVTKYNPYIKNNFTKINRKNVILLNHMSM